MKKLVILVFVLAAVAIFWSKKSEKPQEENIEVNSDTTEETDYVEPESDKEACEPARKENTRAAWEKYLKKFPEGKCAKEGKAVRNQFKKVENLEWSDIFQIERVFDPFYDAAKYCDSLKEDGYTDWRLPNIDELRLLVRNHSGTVAGGKCKISEENNKLNKKDRTNDCEGKKGNNFSKFGDKEQLLSLSDGWWYINFNNGSLFQLEPYSESSVRCVRQDEQEACDTAKRYNEFYYWKHYLENFPNGKCVTEAKSAWEMEDRKTCEAARKENTRAAWEKYLKKFPKGQCTEEGRTVRNKFKKVGGFEWSDISDQPINGDMIIESNMREMDPEMKDYYKDDSYCHLLNEDGHTDWRFPTIDEVRVLVQNHPGTVVGGKCRVSSKDWEFNSLTDACNGVEGNNFSKLGDKERIWSSSEVYMRQSSQVWIIDFSDGELSWQYTFEPLIYIRCVRQDDRDACEAARKEETDEAWERYLFYFPNGKCAKEAKAGAKENAVCERARKVNTRAAWEEYLKKFPNGKCAKEGKAVRNKFRRIGKFEWSDVIEQEWYDENDVCENLKEDGHTDWRKPNIDELRTLVQNHPGTVTGGKCRISDLDYHLGEDFDDENCKGIGGFNFSKLGDSGVLESLSDSSMTDYYKTRLFWGVDFDNGRLSLSGGSYRHRCVRQDESDACETAIKYNKLYYWKHYLANFPQGKCVKEAKVAADELACAEAEYEEDKDKFQMWKDYLKEFPVGKCVKEAKSELEKMDKSECEQARKEKDSWHWEWYLEKFPQGKCATEAKNKIKEIETKKVEPKKWSSRSSKVMSWKQANQYCENLKEGGSSDWRLPTISELRTLIIKCENTEIGGACGVSDDCLSQDSCKNKACGGCGSRVQHNKLGDRGFFWSSSISPDNKNAWYIDFTYGSIHNHSNSKKFVRCVK